MDIQLYLKITEFCSDDQLTCEKGKNLPPKKVVRKHVPALVLIIANKLTKLVQKPKFFVGDTVRTAKTDLPFRKNYKQIFTDEFLK